MGEYNPNHQKTEDLVSTILRDNNLDFESDIDQVAITITQYLRSRLNEQISMLDLQLIGIDVITATKVLAALEFGRRYYYQNKMKKISNEDWDFSYLKQSERQYGVHFFHHYAAKFIPQIPARIIRRFAKSNSIIVDPFMGSGTTLVEAKMLGCNSYGLDTNPMAIKIAKAKTLIINHENIQELDDFIIWLQSVINNKNNLNPITDVSLFEDSHIWFRNDVERKILAILSKIETYSPEMRNFIEVGLSTLLKGISNARMDSVTPILPENSIYIDRKHYYREVNNLSRQIPVYKRLLSQIKRMKTAILEFNKETDRKLICKPINGDARQLQNYVNHCDLVITSPPYWSAQNYEQIHMLSMKLFNLNIEYGAEIGRNEKAYLEDMEIVFRQIALILRGYFCLVIGHDDNMQMHEKLFDLSINIGFKHVDTAIRRISNQASRAKQIKNEYIYLYKI